MMGEWRRDMAWRLRQRLAWSPALRRKRVIHSTAALLPNFSAEQRERFAQLAGRYDLQCWPACCTGEEYIENLYVLDVLDRYLGALRAAQGLEIGCRNFSYLPALHSFAPMPWDGVEIDAHARYWNGYTRQAYGDYMADHFPGCRYLPLSLLDVEGAYDLMVWFLPFVFLEPLSRWGLPRRLFVPNKLLVKAAGLLTPTGRLFIVNQGEHEAAEQQRLCAQTGVPAQALGVIESVFSPFRKVRFGFLIRPHGEHGAPWDPDSLVRSRDVASGVR